MISPLSSRALIAICKAKGNLNNSDLTMYYITNYFERFDVHEEGQTHQVYSHFNYLCIHRHSFNSIWRERIAETLSSFKREKRYNSAKHLSDEGKSGLKKNNQAA